MALQAALSDPEGFTGIVEMNFSVTEHLLSTLEARVSAQTTDCSTLWEIFCCCWKDAFWSVNNRSSKRSLNIIATTETLPEMHAESFLARVRPLNLEEWVKYSLNSVMKWHDVILSMLLTRLNNAHVIPCRKSFSFCVYRHSCAGVVVICILTGSTTLVTNTVIIDNIVLHSHTPNTQFLD